MRTILNLYVSVSDVNKRDIRGVLGSICDSRSTAIERVEERINGEAEDNIRNETRK